MRALLIAAAALTASLAIAADDEAAAVARENLNYLPQTLVKLHVTDLAASTRWYSETLGSVIALDLSEIGFVEMTTPTENLLIGLGRAAKGEKAKGSGGSSILFGTEDIDAARAWLIKLGVKAGEVYEIPGTVRLLEFEDPDGNALMFYQKVQQK